MTPKYVDIQVTAEHIAEAERDVTGRCMIARAIRDIPGMSRVEVDMQTIRFNRAGERETYFTPWDAGNAIVRFDGGDKIEPFSFRLYFRNRVVVQRKIMEPASKPVEAARTRATRAKQRAKDHAADPDVSEAKRAKSEATARAAQEEYDRLKADHGPIRTKKDQPVRHTQTDTEQGIVTGVRKVRYPNLQRTSQRIYGQRIMRANQPDARASRGFTD